MRCADAAFTIFRADYYNSASAADHQLVQNAGGVENVLREMWLTLPVNKKKDYVDYAKGIVRKSNNLTDGKGGERAPHEQQRIEKEMAREQERNRIWQRRDQEKQQKERDKKLKHRADLFRKHMATRKGTIEDMQLLAESITNDAKGKQALGIKTAAMIDPPEGAVDTRVPPELHADMLFIASALERTRDLTELPQLTYPELVSIVRNRQCDDEAGSDQQQDEMAAADSDNVESQQEDKAVVGLRNTVFAALTGFLVRTYMTDSDARHSVLGIDLAIPSMVDALTWPEILRAYLQHRCGAGVRGFPTVEAIRVVGSQLKGATYAELDVQSRVALLVFLCAEIIDCGECKRSVDAGNERITELKRQRYAEQAELKRIRLEKEQQKQAELAAEQRAAFPDWLKARGLDPAAHEAALHPQLWKQFVAEFLAKQAAKENAGEATHDGSQEEEQVPLRTASHDSSETIVIEGEENLSKGEYLRRMRAAREQANQAKADAQRAREAVRAAEQRKRDQQRAVRDKERADETLQLQKEQQYEENYRALAPRLQPLGYDRFHNRYWLFATQQRGKLFVEKANLPEDMLPTQLLAYRACSGSADEKRMAAVDNTRAGLQEVSVEVLQTILQAMLVEYPPSTDVAELVRLIIESAKDAPCSDSYLSMIVHTNRASDDPAEELTTEEEDEDEDEDNEGAAEEADQDFQTSSGAKRSEIQTKPPPRDSSSYRSFYRSAKGVSHASRRQVRSLMTREWQYYDTVDQLDSLLSYLQPNGVREGPLRKTIVKEYEKIKIEMESNSISKGKRSGRKRVKPHKSPIPSMRSIFLELISTFVCVNKSNRSEIDALKSTVRHCDEWHQLVDPVLDLSDNLGTITLRVNADDKSRRPHAESSSHGALWGAWLQKWREFVSEVQTEASFCFALYALRQRVHSTLPTAKRAARVVADAEAARAIAQEMEGEEEEEEAVEDEASWARSLHEAATTGTRSDLRRLLLHQDGNDINVLSADGKTALMIACEKGLHSHVQLLLDNGADLELRDQDGWSALHFAVTDGARTSSACAEALLKNHADAEVRDHEFGMTAWLWACDHGRDNCLRALTAHGCDTRAVDSDKKTGACVASLFLPPSNITSHGRRCRP